MDPSQFGRSFGSVRSHSPPTSNSSGLNRQPSGDNSNRPTREFSRSLNRSGGSQITADTLRGDTNTTRGARPQWNQSRPQIATGQPTSDQVREFLQPRHDNALRQTTGLSNRSLDNNRTWRGGANANLNGNVSDNSRQMDLRHRVHDSQTKGDSAWAGRFGDANNDRGTRSFRRGENATREGNLSRRLGDITQQGDRRGGSDREFGDRGSVDRNYQEWRKHTWRGERGEGRDHRDQSGRWKDGDRFVAAHRIRDHWKGHRDVKDVPFHGGWWKDHHRHHRHWHHWDHFAHHHHRPFFWWSWCPAPRLTTWISFGWSSPYYWDYGPGEYIYCYNDVIYVNGVWFQPAPIYYQHTVLLAQRAPDWTPEEAAQVEWLPLGVFVMARDGVADHNVLVQLAVTTDGVIGGTVYNQTTGATFAIEGTVDKESQRAVWTYVDETNTLIAMETSIYNLTQPEATGLIHYGPDNIQVIQLVRLEEPNLGTSGISEPALLVPAVAR